MTIVFPTFTKVLSGNINYSATSIMNRTTMDSGPPKQAPNQSYSLPTQQVSIIFTLAQFNSFLTWFKDPANGNYGAVFFPWTDAISGGTISARIVNGDFSAQPLSAPTTHMVVKLTLEYHD